MNKKEIVKKIKENKKKIFKLFLGLIFLSFASIYIYDAQKNIFELISLRKEIKSREEDIFLTYHREIKLIERLNILEGIDTFISDCQEYSKKCFKESTEIRIEFLNKLEEETFSNDDLEVLNMISSIDINLREDAEEYDSYVERYSSIREYKHLFFLRIFFSKYEKILE